MLLDDIANFLQANGLGTVGLNIFKGYLPDQPDSLVCLFEYAGDPMEMTLGDGDPILERPGLQVRVRDTSYTVGRQRIDSVVSILHGLAEVMLGGKRYLLIRANQSPEFLGMDANNRSEFVVNFSVLKER